MLCREWLWMYSVQNLPVQILNSFKYSDVFLTLKALLDQEKQTYIFWHNRIKRFFPHCVFLNRWPSYYFCSHVHTNTHPSLPMTSTMTSCTVRQQSHLPMHPPTTPTPSKGTAYNELHYIHEHHFKNGSSLLRFYDQSGVYWISKMDSVQLW